MSKTTKAQLEKHLWGTANLLRGLIDPGDYKKYIFPLLFYKRICDVYDHEYENILEETGDKEEAKKRFYHQMGIEIPDGAHWNDVRAVTKDVGMALQKALREMEKHNPDTLAGVFGDAQWTNKEKFSDAILRDLIEHFSSVNLSIKNVKSDELGDAYEYLIKKFADDSGHTAAEFYTNRTLVRLMTIIMDPKPGESIYDPTCGSGGMLLESYLQVKQHAGNKSFLLKLFGQEINLLTSAIAKMNLYLHGIEDFKIVRGDTLARPAFTSGEGSLRTFDIILANPPYSMSKWNRKAFANDPYGRNLYGVPPQGRADYAFFQHIIKSMDPMTGRCAILFPHGVLFRDEEKAMREKLIKTDVIDCVLGLGPNLFYNSPMEACVIFCKMNKLANKKGKILFINAVNEVTRESAESFLKLDHIEKIHMAYNEWTDIEDFAKVETIETIKEKSYSLNIPLYIRPKGNNDKETITLPEAISNWKESSGNLKTSVEELFSSLKEVGLFE